jgi:hypothetical protein
VATIRKPAIPTVASMPNDLSRILSPLKENIDMITGVKTGAIAQLQQTATLTDVINKINEIVVRLNYTGQ